MKKIRSIFLFLLILTFVLFLNSCNDSTLENNQNVTIGENGNWFIGGVDTNIKAKGEDGRETVFRFFEGSFQWKYVDDLQWQTLYSLPLVVEDDECSKGLVLNEVTGEGFMVIDYIGTDMDVVIPNTYRGIEVTRIADEAFAEKNIKTVRISKTVKIIGQAAFFNCQNLVDVTFEEGSMLEEIGSEAFYYCDSLETINVPSSLQKLGLCAFFLNDSLICEYDDSCGVKYIGNEDNPHLILYDTSSTNLTSCEINANTRFINDYAFTYCSNLRKVTIPEGVVSIGTSAFYYCLALEEVYIPKTVKYIGDATFNCDDGIVKFEVDEENEAYDSRENCNAIIETASNTLIYGCQNTVIPNSVVAIRDKAFYGIGTISYLYIPKSVEQIGKYVFSMCDILDTLIVDPENKYFKSVDSNGKECNVIIKNSSYTQTVLYGGCDNEGKVTIPQGVTHIGEEAFRGRVNLVEITLPKSLYSIASGAFSSCNNLITINTACNLQFTLGSSEYGGIAYKATTINKI